MAAVEVVPVLDRKWDAEYEKSAHFGQVWKDTKEEGAEWPEGVKRFGGRVYRWEKLCVPEELAKEVVRTHHWESGHTGPARLLKEMEHRYEFPPGLELQEWALEAKKACAVCQASDPPNWQAKGPITMTTVPARFMASVSLDVFSLPETKWLGKTYDSFLLCVDRLSGWVIAKPTTKAGLTGEKAAHLMLDGGWGELGIPSVITSDQGAQFVSQWWLTMCARLGVRVAFSQAHRPQANGRAEVAGKSLITVLRRLHVEEGVNWVEALPRALRILHDTVGEGGLSPHQVVFGRDRNLAGIPYQPERLCEDASQFLSRMEKLDVQVAQELNRVHAREAQAVNRRRKARKVVGVGSKVWVLRPKGVGGNKMQSWWEGPCEVTAQTGAASFEVRVGRTGVTKAVHMDQIKEYLEEEVQGRGFPLRYHRGDPAGQRLEPRRVERVLRHRFRRDGALEFLTHWAGTPEHESSWEPVGSFLAGCSQPWLEYCWERNVGVELFEESDPVVQGPGVVEE